MPFCVADGMITMFSEQANFFNAGLLIYSMVRAEYEYYEYYKNKLNESSHSSLLSSRITYNPDHKDVIVNNQGQKG